jgi:hypothetical protein
MVFMRHRPAGGSPSRTFLPSPMERDPGERFSQVSDDCVSLCLAVCSSPHSCRPRHRLSLFLPLQPCSRPLRGCIVSVLCWCCADELKLPLCACRVVSRYQARSWS